MTFVAQFCFADSLDVLSVKPPGDVLLIFFGDEFPFGVGVDDDDTNYRLEWSPIKLTAPTRARDVPRPGTPIPVLHAVRHRMAEYPDALGVNAPSPFKLSQLEQPWLLAVTQSTSIGPTTQFIQGNPIPPGGHLLAALSSIQSNAVWPLLDKATAASKSDLMFYDVGCYYFYLDKRGRIQMAFDCY